MILTPVVDEMDLITAIRAGITLTISSLADFKLLAEVINGLGEPARIHLKIDTGLGRFGLNEQEARLVCQAVLSSQLINIEGIYTHFADPHSLKYTAEQFSRFVAVTEKLSDEGFKIPLRHVANSTVFLRSPEMYLDAVRIGTLLSGQHPVGKFPIRLNLQDPFVFKSRLISLKTLPRGSFLGYYRTFKLKRDAQIGVIPVGFADGLALEVANKPIGLLDMLRKLVKIILGYYDWSGTNLAVQIKDKYFPIRGKVFMQMALIEIPSDFIVQLGDEVIVPVRKTLTKSSVVRKYFGSASNRADCQTITAE
jgi:alanine racemase